MSKIKNIVFDMGGVLIDLDWSACVSSFESCGFPQAREMLDPYLQKGIFMQLERGTVEEVEFYQYIKDHAEVSITDEQIDACLNNFLVGLPTYKLEMLRKLKESYNIYMLSNTNSIMVKHIDSTMFTQEGLTWESYFDRRFLSFEMQLLKPYDDIYRVMLEEGEMNPAETLFLDDAPANIETAKRLGIETYFVKPMEDYREYLYSL